MYNIVYRPIGPFPTISFVLSLLKRSRLERDLSGSKFNESLRNHTKLDSFQGEISFSYKPKSFDMSVCTLAIEPRSTIFCVTIFCLFFSWVELECAETRFLSVRGFKSSAGKT